LTGLETRKNNKNDESVPKVIQDHKWKRLPLAIYRLHFL